MFEWNLKDPCKNKLSEKDGNTILGYCILKTSFFSVIFMKEVLKWSFWIKLLFKIIIQRKKRNRNFEGLGIPLNSNLDNLIEILSISRHVIFPIFTGIPVFLKKTFKNLVLTILTKMIKKLDVWGRDGRKVQMW